VCIRAMQNILSAAVKEVHTYVRFTSNILLLLVHVSNTAAPKRIGNKNCTHGTNEPHSMSFETCATSRQRQDRNVQNPERVTLFWSRCALRCDAMRCDARHSSSLLFFFPFSWNKTHAIKTATALVCVDGILTGAGWTCPLSSCPSHEWTTHKRFPIAGDSTMTCCTVMESCCRISLARQSPKNDEIRGARRSSLS